MRRNHHPNAIKVVFLILLSRLISSPNVFICIQAIDTPKAQTSQQPSSSTKLPSSTIPSKNIRNASHKELLHHYSAFAGKLFPILSKFYIPPSKAKQIIHEITTVARLGEWLTIITIGWATVPFVKYPYNHIGMTKRKLKLMSRRSNGANNGYDEKDDESSLQLKPFEETYLYKVTTLISSAGKIAALVYSIDCIILAINALGFDIQKKYNQLIAKGIYSLWMLQRLIKWKRFIVKKTVYAIKTKCTPEKKKNRAAIANKLTDIIAIVAGGFFLIDVLKIKTGVTLKSFFAVGGAGTILLSIASKDLVIAMVSGLALQASDKMYEGDVIRFGNIDGRVDHIGLIETVITDSNEMVMAIPNKELSSSRLINISKINYSRFTQDLHFEYKDCQQLPDILNDIKQEIRSTCPLVVIDGSKPLRAYFKNYADRFLEVEVDVRMFCQPGSELYKRGRQEVLFAIDRAVRRHNVEFAVVKDTI